MDFVKTTKDLISSGKSIVLCVITEANGSAPRGVGAKMIVCDDGATFWSVGGGAVEMATIKHAEELLSSKKSDTKHFDLNPETSNISTNGMLCGGDVTIKFDYLDKDNINNFDFSLIEEEPPRAIIFGAGHVSAAVCPVLKHVGFRVFVIDNRKDLLNSQAFNCVDETFLCSYKDAFSKVEINFQDYVLVMTPAHIADYEVLSLTLITPAKYIGCLGSPKKSKTIIEKLISVDGFSQKDTDRIYMPVGIKMNAKTPEEIAISIVAQMVDIKNQN